MAGTYDASVTAFYLAYYGRPADPAGLAFWSQAIENNNGDFSAIVQAFSTSTEATVRFGDESVTDRITDIYQQLFSRAPDQAGLDFWANAIASGNASIADIAIQIVGGAQSTDLQLSTLRQDAAAQFTAAVQASGVAYDGDAAIAAARVLIAAVTNSASADTIKSLVTASTALVQTAHDNPTVISALAANGELSALLSTSKGHADPLGAINALTSIAKAAAADPASLKVLEASGGITGLLNSLPAGTSLADLKTSVDTGGLGTAVTIVTAPTPAGDTTPPAAAKLQLVEDTGISTTDHITANGKVQVSGLESGATWQYSLDSGKTWTKGPAAVNGTATLDTTGIGEHTLQVRSTDAAGNVSAVSELKYDIEPTIAFSGADGKHLATDTLVVNSYWYFIDIGGYIKGSSPVFEVSATGADGSWVPTAEDEDMSAGLHYVRYQVPDASGKLSPSNVLKIVMDPTLVSPTVKLIVDSDNGNLDTKTDHLTNDGRVQISGLTPNETWTYSTDGKVWTTGGAADENGVALLALPGDGLKKLQIRTVEPTDKGTAFTSTAFTYTVDTVAAATGLKLVSIEGAAAGSSHTDQASTTVVLSYTGTLDANAGEALFYRIGANGTWTRADSDTQIDTTTKTVTIKDIDLSKGDVTVSLQSTDVAGNHVSLDVPISGPYTTFTATASDTGFTVHADKTAHFYLTDGDAPAKDIGNTGADTDLALGIQTTAAQGILGAGPSATVHSDHAGIAYALGTSDGDTLTGQYVWGYGGDDHIVALGTTTNNDVINSSSIYGGAGADTILATTGNSTFVYRAVTESAIVDGATGAAHGFDTITVGSGNTFAHSQIFDFGVKIGGFVNVSITGYTADTTSDALLALMNTQLQPNLHGVTNAAYVNAAADVNFLVVDADANGTIDGSDFIVKIVGSIDVTGATFVGGTGHMTLATA
jgi:hypothetical protein